MGAVTFPYLNPSGRVYQMGSPATKEFVSLNGSVSLINYGRQMLSDKLQLSFKARKYKDAKEIYDHYQEVMRDGDHIRFPANHPCFRDSKGYQDMLTGNDSSGVWRYESPPTFTALTNGRCDIEVSLIKRLLID